MSYAAPLSRLARSPARSRVDLAISRPSPASPGHSTATLPLPPTPPLAGGVVILSIYGCFAPRDAAIGVASRELGQLANRDAPRRAARARFGATMSRCQKSSSTIARPTVHPIALKKRGSALSSAAQQLS